eukprot:COSAG02_NODE_18473_length_936_cov_1.158901_2_plen_112_part_00
MFLRCFTLLAWLHGAHAACSVDTDCSLNGTPMPTHPGPVSKYHRTARGGDVHPYMVRDRPLQVSVLVVGVSVTWPGVVISVSSSASYHRTHWCQRTRLPAGKGTQPAGAAR